MTIEGDEVRLEQVLQNLLQNAVRYSPNGGRIEVIVAADDRAALASLHVRDHGIGIAADALAQLFERFYRVSDRPIGLASACMSSKRLSRCMAVRWM